MSNSRSPTGFPSGTLTFLFTDIEGSTAHWEHHPQAMQVALARHDAILREAIERHGGQVYKLIGDAFCAAFGVASQSLLAALAAQKALAGEEWGEEVGAIKVRMGLHTCPVEARGGDYVGPGLNRMARMLAVAYGGQTLLSLVTAELVRDQLPPGCRLLDLGERRLKDLVRPERIYQLAAPGLPLEFPPLKTLDLYPHNLPVQLSSFVGREKEMAEVKALLKVTHLLTLVGSGGTGKTRLSLQVAAEQIENFRDGVWLVELAPLSDPALVVGAVAGALKVQEVPSQPLLQTLREHLREKQLLLILDNCEHLIEASARLSESLLQTCLGLKILSSSREALEVGGETTYRVPSLSLPDVRSGRPMPSLEALTQYEAVRLFIDRAVAAQQSFVVNSHNAPALAQICYRLGGIPLAIELAAARVRAMSLEQIEERLSDRFRLLTSGSRTALPRQQTLRATIDWSYELLPEAERVVLRRLAVFAGGWSLEAAEAVCSGEGVEDYEVLDFLQQLINKSLVIVEEQGKDRRYRMLETIREYAADKLKLSGELDRVYTRYLSFFLDLAEKAEATLAGSEQGFWLDRLEMDNDNFRAGLKWAFEQAELELALRLCGALGMFWQIRNYYSEGRRWLDQALVESRAEPAIRTLRAKALHWAGILAHVQSDARKADIFHREALALGRELGDTKKIAMSLNALGLLAIAGGDYPKARSLLEEALAIERGLQDEQKVAFVLVNLGINAIYEGEYVTARQYLNETLEINRALKNTWGTSYSLMQLGLLDLYQNNLDHAIQLFEEGRVVNQAVGDKGLENYFADNLGLARFLQGDLALSGSLFKAALLIRRDQDDKWGFGFSFENFASLAAVQGETLRAARLFGAAEQVFEAAGLRLPPPDLAIYTRYIALARAQTDQDSFNSAWNEGRSMSLEQALSLALAE